MTKQMTRKTGALVGLAAAVLMLATSVAHAQRAEITATGTVQVVSDQDGTLDQTVVVGAPFSFAYVFDYVQADVRDSSSNYGVYYFTASGTGATVTLGDYQLTPGGYLNTASVGGSEDSPPRDGITFQTGGENVVGPGGTDLGGAADGIQLLVPDGSILATNSLPPLSAFDLSAFKPYSAGFDGSLFTASFDLPSLTTGQYGSGAAVRGQINTLSARLLPAPEPSQSLVLAIGLVTLSTLMLKARKRGASVTRTEVRG